MTPLQIFHKNVKDLGKLSADKGLKKLPKVQNIARSGHTEMDPPDHEPFMSRLRSGGFRLNGIVDCFSTYSTL